MKCLIISILISKNFISIVLTINLENLEAEANNARFIVHAVQLVPELNCKAGMEFYKLIDLHEHPNAPLAFAVKVGTLQTVRLIKFLMNFFLNLFTGRSSYGTLYDQMVGQSGNG